MEKQKDFGHDESSFTTKNKFYKTSLLLNDRAGLLVMERQNTEGPFSNVKQVDSAGQSLNEGEVSRYSNFKRQVNTNPINIFPPPRSFQNSMNNSQEAKLEKHFNGSKLGQNSTKLNVFDDQKDKDMYLSLN